MTPSEKGGSLQIIDLLVDLVGIEPTTSSMPWKRAPSCATGPQRKDETYRDFNFRLGGWDSQTCRALRTCPSLFRFFADPARYGSCHFAWSETDGLGDQPIAKSGNDQRFPF